MLLDKFYEIIRNRSVRENIFTSSFGVVPVLIEMIGSSSGWRVLPKWAKSGG